MLVQVFRQAQNGNRSSFFHSFCFTKHKSKCKLRTKSARLTLGFFAHLLLTLCSCSFEKKQPSRRLFCLPQSFFHSVVAFLSAKSPNHLFTLKNGLKSVYSIFSVHRILIWLACWVVRAAFIVIVFYEKLRQTLV
jgi:hypothetical protein